MRLRAWTRHLGPAAIVLLLAASLVFAAPYIETNPRWSARLTHADGRAAPLVALLPLVAALACFQPRLGAARARAAAWLHALTAAAITTWIGAVCISATGVQGDSVFFWGALAPYGLAAAAFVVARAARPRLAHVAVIAAAGALVVAATAILDAAGVWRSSDPLSSLRRPHGIFYNRNYVGEYLALTLPFYLPRAARGRARWLLVPLAMVLVWTRCRTAWIAALFAAGCLVALAPRAHRRRLVLAVGVFALSAVGAAILPTDLRWHEPQPYRATFARLLDVESGSGALRLQQYETTFDLVADWPWTGVGPGRWREEVARVDSALALNRNAHSDYLRALADGGVPAAAALLLLFAVAAVAALRVDGGAFGFVVALAVTAAADCPLYRPETIVLGATVLAAVTAALAAECPRAAPASPAVNLQAADRPIA